MGKRGMALASLVLVAAGCGGGGGINLEDRPFVGQVFLQSSSPESNEQVLDATALVGSIIAGQDPGTATQLFGGQSVDVCGPFPQGAPNQVAALDVGSPITLRAGGSQDILLEPESNMLYRLAAPNDPADVARGVSYDVQFPGGQDVAEHTWSGKLYLPPAVDVTAPDLTAELVLTPGEDLSLTWTPGADGILYVVAADASGESTLFCRVKDDGSFVVPSSDLDTLPDQGLIGMAVLSERLVNLNGSRMSFIGVTGVAAAYTKQ